MPLLMDLDYTQMIQCNTRLHQKTSSNTVLLIIARREMRFSGPY